MSHTIEKIFRYPLKGAGGELLANTPLDKQGIPHDRRYALAFGENGLQQHLAADKWKPWDHFHSLKKNAAMAKLSAAVSGDNGETVLHLRYENQPAASGRPAHPAEKQKLEECLRQILDAPNAALIDNDNRRLWDEDGMAVTLLNTASVRALAEAENAPLEAQRFRANILYSAPAAWEEETLRGAATIGGVRLQLAGGVPRCAATTVNPRTAARDLQVPALIVRRRQHNELGTFATVAAGGEIAVGGEICFEPA